MSVYVVDASVAVKWFVEEEQTDFAIGLLQSDCELLVPDLFFLEVGNVFWKKVMKDEMGPEDAREAMRALLTLNQMKCRASRPLTEYALELSLRYGCTVYDAVYFALAIHADCPFITADRRFYEKMYPLFSGPFLTWIGNMR